MSDSHLSQNVGSNQFELPTLTGKKLNLDKSTALAERAKKTIAGFTQTMMKRPEQFSPGAYPVYLSDGSGALVTDVDGQQYIDFICGLAANSLGHNHPVITRAIEDNLHKGLLHSLPTTIEVEAAETLVGMIPGAEMTRFFKTGADATSAAIRLSRYSTQREEIITVGYNGWHDHFMVDTPGVPSAVVELTTRQPLFTPADEVELLEKLEKNGHKYAALILSLPYNRPTTSEFLQRVKQLCQEKGCIFIVDEIVTGFRLARGGAQEFFGVEADLICLSKGIAGGMPLSAVVGKRELLNKMNDLQVSTTFGGEMLSLAVCKAVLEHYQNSEIIANTHLLGKRFKDGVNRVAKAQNSPLCVTGYDPIPCILFDKNPAIHTPLMNEFLAQCAKRGLLFRRDVSFISGAHTEAQINFSIKQIEQALIEMNTAVSAQKRTESEI